MTQPTGEADLVPYNRFRCGVSWVEVHQELRQEQAEARERGQYRFITRRTVLGRMCQYKRAAYADYREWAGGGRA